MSAGSIRGRLLLSVRDPRGALTVRRCSNVVVQRGAEIVARRFAGIGGTASVDRVQVGFGTETADATTTALMPPPGPGQIPAAALQTPLAAESFAVTADAKARLVRVAITAPFRPKVDLPDVTEAGLMAGDQLYNQVVFEPVSLRVGHDVTFFWEVDFPFGH